MSIIGLMQDTDPQSKLPNASILMDFTPLIVFIYKMGISAAFVYDIKCKYYAVVLIFSVLVHCIILGQLLQRAIVYSEIVNYVRISSHFVLAIYSLFAFVISIIGKQISLSLFLSISGLCIIAGILMIIAKSILFNKKFKNIGTFRKSPMDHYVILAQITPMLFKMKKHKRM